MMSTTVARGLRRLTLAIVGLALLGLIGAWQYRERLAAWEISSLLEQQGLGPVQFVVDEVGVRGFAAHDVSLRDGAIHVEQVKAIYDPLGLAAAHLRRVTLAGLTMSITLAADGIEIGGKPFAVSAPGKGNATGLRIDALDLPDAQIAFASSAGKIESKITTELALTDKGIRSTAFSGRFSAPILGREYSADIEAQELAVEPQSAGGVRLRISQAALTATEERWTAQAIDGEIDWLPERRTARLSVGQLVDQHDPKLVAPLSLTADATLVGSTLDFVVDLLADTKAAAKAEIKGRHDLSSNSGSATITMQPIEFKQAGLQPANLSPAFASGLANVSGRVALGGSVRWDRTGFFPNLLVHLDDLDFMAPIAQFRALTGTIRLIRLWPPATAPGQMLSATVEAGGMPPAKLRLRGELTAAPALKIERAEADFAGGQLSATPFVIEPGGLNLETTLAVNGADLGEIIKLLNVDALSGTGQLDGQIPLDLQNGKIAIKAGRLMARGPGVLRYKPDKVPDQIASAGESVALMMQALSDFHYDSLSLDLDKAPTGEGTVLLRLKGSNPAVMDNQAFNFNIRIDSNFDRLINLALMSLGSAQELLQKASEGDRH